MLFTVVSLLPLTFFTLEKRSFQILVLSCQVKNQSNRMAEGGRDIWVHLVQTLLKQGRPEQGAQSHAWAAFEDLPGGDPQPPGSLCHLQHLHNTEALTGIQSEAPAFQLVPTASCPGTGHHWGELPKQRLR